MVKMNKQTLLEKLKKARAEWDALLQTIDAEQMMHPGIGGEMSVKDVIAHIAWFEREMVAVLQQQALVGSPYWQLPTDERNALIFAENRERPLTNIRAEATTIFAQLVDALAQFPHNDLSDPTLFRDMPLDWIPWQIIAQNSFEHYAHHQRDIEMWQKGK